VEGVHSQAWLPLLLAPRQTHTPGTSIDVVLYTKVVQPQQQQQPQQHQQQQQQQQQQLRRWAVVAGDRRQVVAK